jgi:hypothetical protein
LIPFFKKGKKMEKSHYSGGCFLPGPENKRKMGNISLKGDGVIFTSSDNEIFELSLERLQIKIGGAGDRIVFFSKKNTEGDLVLYSNDLLILDSPLWDKTPSLKGQIEDWRKEKSRGRKVFVGGGILVILFFLVIFFNLKNLKRVLIEAIPLKLERKLGDLMIENMDKGGELIKGEKILNKLSLLLESFDPTIIKERDQIKLHLSRSGQVNAFALPGGHIVINFGLISKARRPEEVLGVLAHEMAHVTERHILNNILDSLGLFSVVQFLWGDFSGVAAVLINQGSFLLQKKFSRSFESEADRKGFHYLVSSGIDPSGLGEFFHFLKKEGEKKKILESSFKGPLSLLSTHPLYKERIDQLEKLWAKVDENSRKKIKPLHFDFGKLKEDISQSLLSH